MKNKVREAFAVVVPSIPGLTIAEIAQEMQRLSDQIKLRMSGPRALEGYWACCKCSREVKEETWGTSCPDCAHEECTDCKLVAYGLRTFWRPPNIVEEATRTLWLDNIPSSTTFSNLKNIFKSYGPITSARDSTHRGGFIIFERLESAISAKATLNNQEIFPTAGPIQIDFAETSPSGTSNVDNTELPSPSLNPAGSTLDWEEEKEEEEEEDLRLSLGMYSSSRLFDVN
jgi:hypothetical protein